MRYHLLIASLILFTIAIGAAIVTAWYVTLTKSQPQQTFLDETEYRKMFDALRAFTTILLFEIEEKATASPSAQTIRLRTIRNFLARAEVTLESIRNLYDSRAYGDCWTLFRTLLDRVFHLHTIADRNEFAAFEEWSFVRQYEINNNISSDTSLTPEQRSAATKPTEEQKKRYKELKARGVAWREPKPEDAAKSLGMIMLYKFGYDHASRFLHPLATDGRVEFEYLTQLGNKGDRGDQRIILHNAALTFTMLLNVALNATQLEWRNLIFDCADAFRKALTDDGVAYAQPFVKIAAAGSGTEWSRVRTGA